MMKVTFRILTCFLLITMASCNNGEHFITDRSYRGQVEHDFNVKMDELGGGFKNEVNLLKASNPEMEAVKFLYAYMPLGDITDYSADYYLENVQTSFQAKQEMNWGKIIPEEFFRHFVLPIRINNENLDESRMVFYKELKDRVKSLSMYDAILEVNHWCHEKVVYTPSDSRTSSPLASVKTAYGRCGEESTFTVAALRSVGIPARQVYTPRWAHTDDNHAWVEAWADGKWYFFGACEPEPVLNLGWFNAPASRGMLMHTKVFGKYTGPEEVMRKTANYTEINVIDNYAPTAKVVVNIKDASGKPVQDAKVEFKLYNYAEFYSVATKHSDAEGKAFLTAGKGDMLVWASKDGVYGYHKVSFGKDSEINITLNKKQGEEVALDFDMVPPVENVQLPEVTPEQRKTNDLRKAHEDSIRNAYVATFMNEEKAKAFAEANNLDADIVAKMLVASRGNHATLTKFLSESKDSERAIKLLQSLSAKDLRDVSYEVLADHYTAKESILSPRVEMEMLTPYKHFLLKNVTKLEKERYQKDPIYLVKWCKKNIKVTDKWNSQHIPMSPAGVWRVRIADEKSRDIFFVAIARTLNINARIDEVTGKVQYKEKDSKDWIDVDFDAEKQTANAKGKLVASYHTQASLDNPKYYSHFTLSKFENGTFKLLSYDEGDTDMGAGTSWSTLLKNGTTLDVGYYMLLTGTRMADGKVLTHVTFFNIEKGKTTRVKLVMREDNNEVQVIGNFNSETKYTNLSGKEVSFLGTAGRGYYVVGILGVNQEPTNHALRDIARLNKQLEKWGRSMILLFTDKAEQKKFNKNEFPGLPSTISYGLDNEGAVRKQIANALKLKHGGHLPVFIVADTFNRVVFVSQGYTIGLGEQLMKVVSGISKQK